MNDDGADLIITPIKIGRLDKLALAIRRCFIKNPAEKMFDLFENKRVTYQELLDFFKLHKRIEKTDYIAEYKEK